jgi:hypothetical integral membrane protein (TIGR02206 family)
MEHILLLTGFLVFMFWFVKVMKTQPEERQRKTLLGIAMLLSFAQLIKIPLNIYTGTFDVTKDIPLHMCNFLPFILVWVYLKKSRNTWATVFFWIVLGVSQANFTPSVQFSLFHYDAIRYWLVHMFPILLALYPAIAWDWELELKDIGRTVIWLNVIAGVIWFLNIGLSSNYLYIMGKPPGTTFFSILPPWPTYILVLEVIVVIWSLMVYGVFRLIKKGGQVDQLVLEKEKQ